MDTYFVVLDRGGGMGTYCYYCYLGDIQGGGLGTTPEETAGLGLVALVVVIGLIVLVVWSQLK
jgi:hypothetical protein